MIDNPAQVEPLIVKLKAALPLPATVSAPMLALLYEQSPGSDLSPRCQITGIHYTGDEGGIVCRLDFGDGEDEKVFFAAITHLTFDRRLPLAREIAAYQKHRIKRIRRGAARESMRFRRGQTARASVGSVWRGEHDPEKLFACFRPSSVKTTDLALFTGSAIMPLSWSRLRASQSKPFHARQWS